MPVPGEHHPAFEEYCECIFELDEDDVEVIQARIAERLQVSRPAVSEMIRNSRPRASSSTRAGSCSRYGPRTRSADVVRHVFAERFLTDILKLSWAEAHHEAGEWEHVVSIHVEEAMNRVLGEPTTCPHGNPIPGSELRRHRRQPALAADRSASAFTVRRIPEELEFTPGLLEFLEASSLRPGCSGVVTAASPDGTLTIEIDGRHVGVGAFASERILVTT